MLRINPLAAALTRTIEPIRSAILIKLLIPPLLERLAEQVLNPLERYHLFGAALRRHELRVLRRQDEHPLDAGVAHAVPARQFGGLEHGDFIVAAGYAGYFAAWRLRWWGGCAEEREKTSAVPAWCFGRWLVFFLVCGDGRFG